MATSASDGGQGAPPSRPRVAVVAYVCGPEEGSEPGAGWAWARMLASIGDVTLITLDEEPRASRTDEFIDRLGLEPRIRHVTVPYPRWWVGPLHRFERLSYLAWLLGMVAPVRALGLQFELAWHVTLANVWLGSTAYQLAPRFVLGPVGGGVATPWGIAPAVGATGFLFEVQRTVAQTLGRWVNPLARAAWDRASLILAQNEETVAWLPAGARARTVVFPNVVVDFPIEEDRRQADPPSSSADGRQALTVGRLLPWKGVALAVRAMAYLPDWRLTIVGDGPDRGRLERLVRERDVTERVTFVGWLPRPQVHERMVSADVMFFPSLHEEGGWAAAEAGALGLPAIALDRGGPSVLGTRGVPATTPERTARALAALARHAARGGGPAIDRDAWSIARQQVALVNLLQERGLLDG